jgi:predicted DNA-binding antitoxin AbrB/MazE fold protein
MTYHGRVRNGVVVLDQDVQLPEGAEVTVEVSNISHTGASPLMKYAGQATDLPEDASRSVDQILYGDRQS